MVITPSAISAAAPIAMSAEMLRMIFLCARFSGDNAESGEALEDEELGLRTIGFGRTPGQEMLTTAPQRPGLPDTEEGGMVLKKLPAGRSPEKRLCEILKDERRGRSESCFGSEPERLLSDKSMV